MSEAVIEIRVNYLEEALLELARQASRTEYKIDRLSQEMGQFKDEMKEFKDEMKEFKDEMSQFKNEMNKKWGGPCQ